MQLKIPLMPLVLDVRIRRLPALRASLLGLMIAVACFGTCFGLVARMRHLNLEAAYHRQAARGAGPEGAGWHEARYVALERSHQQIDFPAFVAIVGCGSLVVAAVAGRALDLIFRRIAPDLDLERPRS